MVYRFVRLIYSVWRVPRSWQTVRSLRPPSSSPIPLYCFCKIAKSNPVKDAKAVTRSNTTSYNPITPRMQESRTRSSAAYSRIGQENSPAVTECKRNNTPPMSEKDSELEGCLVVHSDSHRGQMMMLCERHVRKCFRCGHQKITVSTVEGRDARLLEVAEA